MLHIQDKNNDHHLSKQEVASYFRIIFMFLLSLSRRVIRGEVSASQLYDLAVKAAAEKTELFFELADIDRDDLISFEEYRTTHDRHPRFFEWFEVFTVDDETSARANKRHMPVVSMPLAPLNNSTIELELYEKDIYHMQYLRKVLQDSSAVDIINTFSLFSDPDYKTLTRYGFNKTFATLLNKKSLSKTFYVIYNNIFDLFDTSGDGVVSEPEFLAGLLLLTGHANPAELILSRRERNSDAVSRADTAATLMLVVRMLISLSPRFSCDYTEAELDTITYDTSMKIAAELFGHLDILSSEAFLDAAEQSAIFLCIGDVFRD
jgi:hypothetical protein